MVLLETDENQSVQDLNTNEYCVSLFQLDDYYKEWKPSIVNSAFEVNNLKNLSTSRLRVWYLVVLVRKMETLLLEKNGNDSQIVKERLGLMFKFGENIPFLLEHSTFFVCRRAGRMRILLVETRFSSFPFVCFPHSQAFKWANGNSEEIIKFVLGRMLVSEFANSWKLMMTEQNSLNVNGIHFWPENGNPVDFQDVLLESFNFFWNATEQDEIKRLLSNRPTDSNTFVNFTRKQLLAAAFLAISNTIEEKCSGLSQKISLFEMYIVNWAFCK